MERKLKKKNKEKLLKFLALSEKEVKTEGEKTKEDERISNK